VRKTLMTLAAVLALVAGACADEDVTDDPPAGLDVDEEAEPGEVVSAAAAETLERDTAVVVLTLGARGAVGADEADEEGTEEEATEAERVLQVQEDLAEDRRVFVLDEDPGVATPAVVVDGTTVYVEDLEAGDDARGEQWLRAELDEAAEQDRLPDGFPFRDTRHLLEVLSEGGGEATRVTEEEGGGEAGSPDDADDLTGGSPEEDADETDTRAGPATGVVDTLTGPLTRYAVTGLEEGLEDVTVEVAVDSDGMVREISYAPEGDDEGLVVTARYVSFDDELEIEVPDEGVSDVDMEQLREALPDLRSPRGG
jgi:hypothetical protein